MAEDAGSAPASLPDEIVVWEILVRLPPKALLRCRVVCPAWRSATSTRSFLLAHHARQPTLPLLYSQDQDCQTIVTFDHHTALPSDDYNNAGDDLIPFDHRGGLAAADQLQLVTRLGFRYYSYMRPHASCDGLLIHTSFNRLVSICNPATRQYASPKQIYAFDLLGMYRHGPTGEYRLLLAKSGHQYGSYIFTLGSSQPPRSIGNLESRALICPSTIMFRGNLHWHIKRSPGSQITVFDTTTELFSQMHAPDVPEYAYLFEMGDMLGMASFRSVRTIIDIWVMKDYDSKVWALKCRIELPLEELRLSAHDRNLGNVVVMPGDGELLLLVETEDWLHHVDINGRLVASFCRTGLKPTQLRLKQSLVPHTFFPTLEGYVVNDSPFV
ncbi:unnamed protein product [Alopecurus aequalis]